MHVAASGPHTASSILSWNYYS